jgi:hypothetical protein
MVSPGLASKPVATVSPSLESKLVVDGFLGLGLKTGNYGLVIWVSKSPRRFFGFDLKTKRGTVCWLHHKTDGRMKTMQGTCRDLTGCIA